MDARGFYENHVVVTLSTLGEVQPPRGDGSAGPGVFACAAARPWCPPGTPPLPGRGGLCEPPALAPGSRDARPPAVSSAKSRALSQRAPAGVPPRVFSQVGTCRRVSRCLPSGVSLQREAPPRVQAARLGPPVRTRPAWALGVCRPYRGLPDRGLAVGVRATSRLYPDFSRGRCVGSPMGRGRPSWCRLPATWARWQAGSWAALWNPGLPTVGLSGAPGRLPAPRGL